MNPSASYASDTQIPVPRTRGDEPLTNAEATDDLSRSPHARG